MLDQLSLLDCKPQVFGLYAEIRATPDPAWVCPLAPPPNRLGFAVSAGERHESD